MNKEEKAVGKAAIGNLLGGIGYFYGQSKIAIPKGLAVSPLSILCIINLLRFSVSILVPNRSNMCFDQLGTLTFYKSTWAALCFFMITAPVEPNSCLFLFHFK